MLQILDCTKHDLARHSKTYSWPRILLRYPVFSCELCRLSLSNSIWNQPHHYGFVPGSLGRNVRPFPVIPSLWINLTENLRHGAIFETISHGRSQSWAEWLRICCLSPFLRGFIPSFLVFWCGSEIATQSCVTWCLSEVDDFIDYPHVFLCRENSS
jgi:hypothetical protein